MDRKLQEVPDGNGIYPCALLIEVLDVFVVIFRFVVARRTVAHQDNGVCPISHCADRGLFVSAECLSAAPFAAESLSIR